MSVNLPEETNYLFSSLDILQEIKDWMLLDVLEEALLFANKVNSCFVDIKYLTFDASASA